MKAQALAVRVQVRRLRHLGAYGDPKTASARRTVELFPEVVQLLREIQPLRVTPEMPVFTNNIRGGPIEPNALLRLVRLSARARDPRPRALLATKDTFVTAALQAGVKIGWLENQTGVNYLTLRRHYGRGSAFNGGADTYPRLTARAAGVVCIALPDTLRVRLPRGLLRWQRPRAVGPLPRAKIGVRIGRAFEHQRPRRRP